MDATPDLDEFKPWNVKDFPSALRQRITHAASTQGATVAEWLTAYFQKHGIEGEALPVIPVKITPLTQVTPRPSQSELGELAQMARSLTPEGKDSAAMKLARSLVRDRLMALRPATEAKPAAAPKMLAAPEGEVGATREEGA